MHRRPTLRRRLAGTLVGGLVGGLATAVAASGLAGAPAQAAWEPPVFQRVISGPASPQVYAWGTVYNPVSDEVLVADYISKTVRRYDTAGTYLGTTNGPTDAGLYAGLSVDPRDGSFYVGTQQGGGGKVLKFDVHGNHLFTLDPPGLSPFSAVDQDGYLYLNQRTGGAYVEKYLVDDLTRSATLVQTFRAPSGGWYNDVDVTSDGRVFAVQQDRYRVQVFHADGSPAYVLGAKGKGPGRFNGDMRGLSVDEERGRVYVVDGAANQVEVFDLDGSHLATWGDGVSGKGPGQFQDGGRQVTVGADGTVYVADYGNFRIVPFAADGTPAEPFPRPAVDPDRWGYNSIMDVAVDPVDGSVVGIDSYNMRYQRFTAEGELVGAWGRRGNGPPYGFNYPKGIGIDPQTRNVWVVHQELGDPDITVYTPEGGFVQEVVERQRRDAVSFHDGLAYVLASGTITVRDPGTGAEVARWGGVSGSRNLGIDPATGHLYLPAGNQIRVFTASGAYLHALRGGTRLHDAVVVGDVVYATDRGAGEVLAFDRLSHDLLGAVATKGSLPGQVSAPQGIAAGPDGTLYVADRNNHRISVFGSTPVGEDTVTPRLGVGLPPAGAPREPGAVTITGAATDTGSGVARVEVALRDQRTGLWWNPKTSTWTRARLFDTAFGYGPSHDLAWRYTFVGAEGGSRYSMLVRVRDRAGLLSQTVSRTFWTL